ncbi:hypothetical protein JMJ77_0008368 [Colletotrichum scovillei]|uniref:Uncharacterized protein n=1 Tax=Colletotrichum scovillei TaxID=1209932 RepID=A0A9P7RGD7_9PEZI|nr:hypothetical protein JMJ77_0008368 [Colletotrichum scovillei]KAG7075287.1 hypothetical protein JMJ76_0011747 [Colletotrichum scovillei]KAG7082506.1 hypothetical protein JMJ78_0004607 [Colletotrichum scovillei]
MPPRGAFGTLQLKLLGNTKKMHVVSRVRSFLSLPTYLRLALEVWKDLERTVEDTALYFVIQLARFG